MNDVSEILKSANTGGMTHYKVSGRGITKAEAVAVGRGYHPVYTRIYSED